MLTFPARRLAVRVGFVAEPDERRVHQPGDARRRAGWPCSWPSWWPWSWRRSSHPALRHLSGLVGAARPDPRAAAIFVVGLIDDVRDMSAPAKVAGEVLAAMVLVFLGVTMFQFKIPLVGSGPARPRQWTPLLTALWVIVITNAVNLIDGLDGLATGIVAIASGALAIYGLRLVHLGNFRPTTSGPLIAVIAFGVCVGFLPHNFHPAKAFMGDAGALCPRPLDGGVHHADRGPDPPVSEWPARQTYFFFLPLFIPFFILGRAHRRHGLRLRRRTAKGTGFHTPDKNHLHHRLLRLGHGPRRTVVILWAWTALLSGFVLFPLFATGQRRHPLRGPGPRPGPLHAVPPVPPPGGRPRGGGGRGRTSRAAWHRCGPGPRRTGTPRCRRIIYALTLHPPRRAPFRGPCRPPWPGPCPVRRPAPRREQGAIGRAERLTVGPKNWTGRGRTERTGGAHRRPVGPPKWSSCCSSRARVGRASAASESGAFPTFCRHDLGGAMILPVNCRPVATSVGIERAGHSTGYDSRTTA